MAERGHVEEGMRSGGCSSNPHNPQKSSLRKEASERNSIQRAGSRNCQKIPACRFISELTGGETRQAHDDNSANHVRCLQCRPCFVSLVSAGTECQDDLVRAPSCFANSKDSIGLNSLLENSQAEMSVPPEASGSLKKVGWTFLSGRDSMVFQQTLM